LPAKNKDFGNRIMLMSHAVYVSGVDTNFIPLISGPLAVFNPDVL
jgi:hypothetical protein